MSNIKAGDRFTVKGSTMDNIIRKTDRYNKDKVWLIKRYPSGNYYINQEICGRTFYDGFVRTTAKHLAGIIGRKELKCLLSEAK